MLRWWKKNKKQQILCPLSSRKSSLLRAPTFISEKIIGSQQSIRIKSIAKNQSFVSKSHFSTLLLKVVVQKTLEKSHKWLSFTIRTSLVQELFVVVFTVTIDDRRSIVKVTIGDRRSIVEKFTIRDRTIYDRDRIAWLMIDDRH